MRSPNQRTCHTAAAAATTLTCAWLKQAAPAPAQSASAVGTPAATHASTGPASPPPAPTTPAAPQAPLPPPSPPRSTATPAPTPTPTPQASMYVQVPETPAPAGDEATPTGGETPSRRPVSKHWAGTKPTQVDPRVVTTAARRVGTETRAAIHKRRAGTQGHTRIFDPSFLRAPQTPMEQVRTGKRMAADWPRFGTQESQGAGGRSPRPSVSVAPNMPCEHGADTGSLFHSIPNTQHAYGRRHVSPRAHSVAAPTASTPRTPGRRHVVRHGDNIRVQLFALHALRSNHWCSGLHACVALPR